MQIVSICMKWQNLFYEKKKKKKKKSNKTKKQQQKTVDHSSRNDICFPMYMDSLKADPLRDTIVVKS